MQASAPGRVLSIDVLRGLTIAFMILVNDPGDWAHVYGQLDHAAWNGFTCTDFVFPSFLFLVGASITFSLQSRIARGASGKLDKATRRTLALHIFRRAILLFAIKMFLTGYPHFHWTHLRIYGVLTRIALCYLAAGLVCLAVWNAARRTRILVAITAALLLGYWVLMRFVPVPGIGTPTHEIAILDPNNNLAAWLDRIVNAFTQRWLHIGRLYETTRDPEGLLSTLPAVATTLIGAVTGLYLDRTRVSHARRSLTATDVGILSTPNSPHRRLITLFLTGLAALAGGLLWNPYFPINKNLWTSSYVLYAAGWSLLLLALLYYLIDVRRLNQTKAGRWLVFPWQVFGSNAIFAFVFSNFIVETLIWIKVPSGDPAHPKPVTAWFWIYHHLFASHQSNEHTSLAFAVAFVAFCFLPTWLLYRRRIFLKI